MIRKRLVGAVDWGSIIISSMVGYSLRMIVDIISKTRRLDTQFFEGIAFLIISFGAATFYQPFSVTPTSIILDKVNYPLLSIAFGAAMVATIKLYNSLKKFQSKEA